MRQGYRNKYATPWLPHRSCPDRSSQAPSRATYELACDSYNSAGGEFLKKPFGINGSTNSGVFCDLLPGFVGRKGAKPRQMFVVKFGHP
jgi:hypothetical protein